MKVGGYSPLGGGVPVQQRRPVDRVNRARPASGASSAQSAGGVSETHYADQASVLGIPEAELTPKVRDAIKTLMQEVDSLRKEVEINKRRMEELEKLADLDTLAPIANRRAFVRDMSRVMSYTDRYGVPSCLAFFDVNGLKQVNDTLGHAAGDKVLISVSKVLLDHIRESDVVGRLGGDEFGVILAQADEPTGKEKARQLAEAIRATTIDFEGTPIQLDVAWGVVTFKPGADPGETLAEADKRMYLRKREMKAGKVA